MVTFHTTLLATGGNNVGIVVPEEVVLGFDRGNRVPVVVMIDGEYSFRNTISMMRGHYLISFNAQTRAATGKGAGDKVEVSLEIDDEPRPVDVPPDLAAVFDKDPGVAEAWSRLSSAEQNERSLSIETAESDATRERRIHEIVEALQP